MSNNGEWNTDKAVLIGIGTGSGGAGALEGMLNPNNGVEVLSPWVQDPSEEVWDAFLGPNAPRRQIVLLDQNLEKRFQQQYGGAMSTSEKAELLAKEKSEEIEAIAKQLSKYLSPQLYDSIFSGEKKVIINSEKKFLTVFFSDLVSFTNISDTMASAPLTKMLNDYLTKMTDIALSYGATIDKYIGDSIMVFFGDPETKGQQKDAINCVEMAKKMQIEMNNMSKEWKKTYSLSSPLKIRIGINSGECTVGNFGSDRRLDYTVIGSPVNLASRLESLAPHNGILISDSTHSLIKDSIECNEFGKIDIKGFKKKFKTFNVKL